MTSVRAAGWSAAFCIPFALLLNVAFAHAPLARDLAVSSGGDTALRMPGFGIVLSDTARGDYAYACDALLGLEASNITTAHAYRSDGSLLLGAPDRALRVVDRDACGSRAASGWPTDVGVAALTAHPTLPTTFYAATAETETRIYRSTDSGDAWQLQGTLDDGAMVTALKVTAAAHLYVSRAGAPQHTDVLVSDDGGATFSTTSYGATFSLLYARSGSPDVLWALSSRPESGDFAILRGAATAASLSVAHRVRFFGGFATDDAHDTVWVADEAGSLFRSSNGGDDFQAMPTDHAIACLVHDGNALWACTTGTNQQPALAVSDDQGETFTSEIAFADVERLVDCDTTPTVAQTCAGAWIEWQADVLERAPIDASVSDASIVDAATGDASDVDATPDAGTTTPASNGGCACNFANRNDMSDAGPSALPVWVLLGLLARYRKRGANKRDSRCAIHR